MAKQANLEDLAGDSPSSGSMSFSEEDVEQQNEMPEDLEDEEELEAVAGTTIPDEEDSQSTEDDRAVGDVKTDDEEDEETDESTEKAEIGKREKARLRDLQRTKRQKIQELLDAQNASIEADMNNKGKGRLKYLLQQTEIFAHFAKGSQSVSDKKPRGRGRHASKLTEEEEDEECLKEEEDGFDGARGTRLVTQPSCNCLTS